MGDGDVQTPQVVERSFRNLNAALDYASIFEPKWLEIVNDQVSGVLMRYVRKEETNE